MIRGCVFSSTHGARCWRIRDSVISSGQSDATKWCHVVCTAYGGRQLFKIPAAARFCERYVCDECAVLDWIVDAVAVSPTRIQALIGVPPGLTRADIARQIQQAGAEAARHAGTVRPWYRQLWKEPTWCAVLTNGVATSLLRRHIRAQSRSGTRLGRRTTRDLPVPPQYAKSQRAADTTSDVWGSTKSSNVGA